MARLTVMTGSRSIDVLIVGLGMAGGQGKGWQKERKNQGMVRKYRLEKDLPTFKAGKIFQRNYIGLWAGEPLRSSLIYNAADLSKFPNILTDWFEAILEEPKTVWDLRTEDIFYIIKNGRVTRGVWNHGAYTMDRDTGDVFLTKDEAERELARRKAKQVLLRDTKGFKPDPKNFNFGWAVSYEVMGRNPHLVASWCEYVDESIRFRTKEDALNSINTHEKEWKTYLGVEE